MKKILLVEDDSEVASFIRKGLTEEGYAVTVTFDGPTGLQTALTNQFDVIILDLMLPGMNGIDVCRGIRKENKNVSILFLTALGTSENIVIGLESEADDYLVKPFKFIELLARIKSLLRRSDVSTPPMSLSEEIYQFSDLNINDYTKTVKRGANTISLTSTEYRLLLLFVKNPGRVFSRLEILEMVWSIDFNLGTNVVDVYVNYLRKKVDKDKSNKLIHTVIGMGYVMKEADEDTD
ncbi:MAG TPA: response regulator transcription factor [Chryseolinea sp.]|nr:response regulator transcription factor [Chryseolinea sp.]HPH47477.1 response regulator transcription factor [Chryseolinea sp.]HPM31900.1 response regulator transcription factor [Chryseolinea sp.]